jgi:hypothetical protein
MISTRRLIFAGWLAMTSALVTIPWLILSFFLDKTELWVKVAEGTLLVGSTALFVYTFLTLRVLLHRYAFSATDRPIALLIQTNIVTTTVSLLALAVPSIADGAGVVGIGLVVAIGVFHALFGLRLLHLTDDLGGLHRPYCYLNMITGICLASLVLLPVGILSSAVADVMLGTIFFRAGGLTSQPAPR